MSVYPVAACGEKRAGKGNMATFSQSNPDRELKPMKRKEIMALELYMLGLVVHDMPTALEFYRRLGLAIPDGSEKQSDVEVKMGNGFTFFLNSNPTRWDPGFDTQSDPSQAQQQIGIPLSLNST